MKKILSLLMALTMIISCVCAVDFVASADDNRYGVDISEHNGSFDIAARKKKGESFIMIRLGYIAGGKWITDNKFWANVENAHNAEMNFGVYFYSYAFDTKEAMEEADFVIDTLSKLIDKGYGEYFTLPVAYDLEDKLISNHFSTAKDKGKAQITQNMVTFCDAVRNAGYTPMVYANTNWFENYIDIKTAFDNNYKLWYAWYPNTIPTEFGTQREIGSTGYYADIWQYAVTNEVVGELDKNVMYSSMWCETHTYKNKVTAPTCTNKGYTTHTCTKCGYSYKDTYTSAKGHSYKNVISAAAIGKNGKITPTCSVCKATKTATTIYAPKTLTLSATSYTYNGKVKTPSVTVKDSKGKTLVKNTDYTVTYASGRTKIGKYKVTVTFKGNYSGKKELYFTIKPAKTSISSLKADKKALTVKWTKKTTQVDGYQIRYSSKNNFSTYKTVKIASNKTVSKKITGLSANKKYYVKIRTYKKVGDTTYYSDWSSAKSIKTK